MISRKKWIKNRHKKLRAPIKLICHRRRQIYIRGWWDRDSQHHPLTRNATKGQTGGGDQNYTFAQFGRKNRDGSKYDVYIYIFHEIYWSKLCNLQRPEKGAGSKLRSIPNTQHIEAVPSQHSRLIPMYNARFILWSSSLSSSIRKKLVNGQMPEMRSQPLKQSLCLATQSQLGQSIATNREIRSEKFQNFISIFRELFAMDSHW